MKAKYLIYAIVILIIVLENFSCTLFTGNTRETNAKNNLITEDKAVEIAKDAIKGRMEYDETGKITVEQEEGQYIVTFPYKLPAGWLGPDYAARVSIDSKTGKVIKLLVGS